MPWIYVEELIIIITIMMMNDISMRHQNIREMKNIFLKVYNMGTSPDDKMTLVRGGHSDSHT